ncbi:MAG TPA: hypothetical protein VN577_08745 [Terriglobales bacterium]|nr:hypothetical protein [Terriglobales bacterium]
MKRYIAHLKSTSPISFSRYHGTPKRDRESDQDYEERTWRERLHTDARGNVLIPLFALKNALDAAAKYEGKKIPGKRNATFTKHVNSGVMVESAVVLPVKKSAVRGEWRFVPADGTPGGAKRVMKCFPVISDWHAKVSFAVIDEIITKDILQEFLEVAGSYIGIGSFRPENRGIWGRFKVLALNEAKKVPVSVRGSSRRRTA